MPDKDTRECATPQHAEGPLHAALITNVAKWAEALAPEFGEGVPALRLGKLAKEAASPFPLLVVAHRAVQCDRYGDVTEEGYFETRTVDDAPELVAWLVNLEVKEEFDRSHWFNEIEFHRLAKRTRMIDGYEETDLSTDEIVAVGALVKAEVDQRTVAARNAAEVKAQERRALEAKRVETHERAQLAELKSKYEST